MPIVSIQTIQRFYNVNGVQMRGITPPLGWEPMDALVVCAPHDGPKPPLPCKKESRSAWDGHRWSAMMNLKQMKTKSYGHNSQKYAPRYSEQKNCSNA